MERPASSGSQGSPTLADEEEAQAGSVGGGGGTVSAPSAAREQDMYVPVANVSRLMKRILPDYAKISKDSKYIVQECVSEFITFITSEANDKCYSDGRKTISGDDVLWAMAILGFENYVEPLKVYLQHIRELEKNDTKALNVNDGGLDNPAATNVSRAVGDLSQQL